MSYDLLSVCMCVQGEMLLHSGFVCVCVQSHASTWHADFVFGCLYVFACF